MPPPSPSTPSAAPCRPRLSSTTKGLRNSARPSPWHPNLCVATTMAPVLRFRPSVERYTKGQEQPRASPLAVKVALSRNGTGTDGDEDMALSSLVPCPSGINSSGSRDQRIWNTSIGSCTYA
ncbi:hypothetical protein EJB05_02130 [Eragrostis curvula]|uniref:Uncharacterized protein n=1 Tax=Eragrostis curvula TaxID=38414 RepID=A0A5J9WPQ6_9POAL|nr:hypothetical protein EJB05_02130 [Eragrostis curvula]